MNNEPRQTQSCQTDVSRSLENYNHVLGKMNGNEDATRVCLMMMNWLIKDIEIRTGKDLEEYKVIWEKAFDISLSVK